LSASFGKHKVIAKGLLRSAALVTGAVALLTLMWLWASSAFAQGTGILSSSYITPFPQTDRYQVRVIGDWLGSGLTTGLQDAFKQDGSLQITDASRSNFGLARSDQTSLFDEVDRMLSSGPVHVAIIMLGANDRYSIKIPAGRAQPGSPEWKDAYGKEAERLIKKLKAANVAVYWVGLPVMGNPSFSDAVAAMNDAVRQAAYLNGVKFIETWSGFTDQLGSYSAYGPDLTGQTKRLREGDGIGLTAAGNRKLANYVEVILRRDLAQARAQRNIPLAGDEEEQARVVPGNPRNTASAKGSVGADAKQGQQTASARAPGTASDGQATAPASGTATSNNGGASPANTQSQEQSRRDQAAFSTGFQQGEMVLGDLGDGLTAIAIISPLNEFTIRDIQRQTPLGDRVYFRVLSKGEALKPKEGRADDFRWRGASSQ
jgi:hypothetical protein